MKIDPETKAALDEFYKEEIRIAQEEAKFNNEILDSLRLTLGKEYVEDIIECLKESEAGGKLEIVPNPGIKKQNEDWGSFDHILVDQYVNGGYLGDEFAGYVYIPINDGQYLKSHYSM